MVIVEVQGTQKKMTRLLGMRTTPVWIALLILSFNVAAFAGKMSQKTVATADGRPIRKVFIRTAAADTATTVAAALTQDTCLTTVNQESKADAVLDVGITLPGVGGGMPMPTVFVPSATEQTLGNGKNQPQRSASANCSNGKDSGCTGSYNIQGGDLGTELPPGFANSASGGVDVSLISTGKSSQELWQPETHKKRPWTDQLRRVVGCPVCPTGHFNRRRDKSYRNWIQAKCPAVLTTATE